MVISDKPGLVTYISPHNLVNIVLCRLTTPLYKQCGVCELNYQRIVKVETFNADLRSVLTTRGIGWLPLSHLNSHASHQVVSAKNITALFSGVPPALIR